MAFEAVCAIQVTPQAHEIKLGGSVLKISILFLLMKQSKKLGFLRKSILAGMLALTPFTIHKDGTNPISFEEAKLDKSLRDEYVTQVSREIGIPPYVRWVKYFDSIEGFEREIDHKFKSDSSRRASMTTFPEEKDRFYVFPHLKTLPHLGLDAFNKPIAIDAGNIRPAYPIIQGENK